MKCPLRPGGWSLSLLVYVGAAVIIAALSL